MRGETDEGFQKRMEDKAAKQRYFGRPVTADGRSVDSSYGANRADVVKPRDRSAAATKHDGVCKGPCGRKLRAPAAKADDHPGSIAHYGLGYCKKCHGKREAA